MARFLFQGELLEGLEVTLSPEESHHLARVLRMEAGEAICLVNGEGTRAEAQIKVANPTRTQCLIGKTYIETRKNSIHLAFAIPKSAALDFIIHRCTELGVASFQPLMSQHSLHVNQWNDERWNKIVIEVAKQCQENFFPKINPPQSLQKWLGNRIGGRTLVYCDEEERSGGEKISPTTEWDLLIGAEGGWSEEERQLFKQHGQSLGLGRNRLRAETAALVGLTLLKKKVGEI